MSRTTGMDARGPRRAFGTRSVLHRRDRGRFAKSVSKSPCQDCQGTKPDAFGTCADPLGRVAATRGRTDMGSLYPLDAHRASVSRRLVERMTTIAAGTCLAQCQPDRCDGRHPRPDATSAREALSNGASGLYLEVGWFLNAGYRPPFGQFRFGYRFDLCTGET